MTYLGIVTNFMMNFDYWEFNYFMSTLVGALEF